MENVFDLLDPKVSDIIEKMGVLEPTEPQRRIIPLVLEGRNVLLLSPTGSGKTEAAAFPVFTRMLRERPEKISALYITPLRALNRDMLGRLMEYSKEMGLSVQVRHSDITQAQRRRIVTDPPDLLITTPESLQIMLNGKRLRQLISRVRYVIVDEVHELAQNERGTQFSVALERLKNITGQVQIIGLSATVGNPEELGKFISPDREIEIVRTSLVKKLRIEPVIAEKADSSITEKMGCDSQYAGTIKRMWELVSSHRGTLIFVNTRSSAEDLAFRLRLWLGDVPILVHHGSLSKETRETAERAFKAGEVKALICTSSLELGIDIGSADLVIQLNSPRQVNKMIQRVGRSGHWIEKVSKGQIICNDVIELEEALAISQLASRSDAENINIKKGSMATAANQVMLMLSFLRRASADDIYSIIGKAYPFRDMQREEFDDLVKFLADTRKLYMEEQEVGKRSGVLKYYLENISMIPSEKTYRVIDIVNKKFIGTLDERYVLSELEPGSYFVMKGSTWRATRIEEEKILAEPFSTTAIAPKWTGEDIPVLAEVVDQVSENRKHMDPDLIEDGNSRNVLAEWWQNELGQKDRIIIESRSGEVIIQVLLGTKGNFAFAEILSSLLSSITGESVEMDYSPYHIYLRTSRNFSPEDIHKVLLEMDPDRLSDYVLGSARRTRFFNGVFLYEARKFGVISTDSEIGRIRFEKIVDSYRDTILYRDSIRKLISDYMDLNVLKDFLLGLRDGTVACTGRKEISDSSGIFMQHYSERVAPLVPTKAILDAIKNRLLNERTILYCTSCGNVRTMRVKEVKSIKCPFCSSYLVASLSEFENDRLREFLKDPEKHRDFGRRLKKNAHVVKERGMEALMALSARGIGSETASRLLQVTYFKEDDFIRAVLNAEIEFAKSRRYWD